MTLNSIGSELRRRRFERRLSRRELGKLAHVHHATVGRIEERGQIPTWRVIRSLESVLGRFDLDEDESDPEASAPPAATPPAGLS